MPLYMSRNPYAVIDVRRRLIQKPESSIDPKPCNRFAISRGNRSNGQGRPNLLETSVLSIGKMYSFIWIKDELDLQELANKRWIERWSMEKLVEHFGYGRTAIVRKLGQLKRSPDLIVDGMARSHVKSRKYRFMGGA